MVKHIGFSLLLTGYGLVMSAGVYADPATARHAEAESLFSAGLYDEALPCYRALYDADNSDWNAAFALGLIYKYTGDYAYSEYYFSQAANLKPKNGRMWYELAETERLNSNFDSSGEHYLKASDCGFKDQLSVMMGVSMFAEAKRYDEAIALLDRLQPPVSSLPEAAALRGRCLLETGKAVEASAAYETACETRPDNPIYSLGYARSLHATGRYTEAMQLCDHITEDNPRYMTAYLLAGEAAIENGTPERSKDYAYAAMEVKPGYPPALLLLGRSEYELGDSEAAIQYYEQALGETPHDSRIYTFTGDALLKLDMTDRAEEAYRQALIHDRGNPLHYYKLGLIKEMQDSTKTAIEYYNNAINLAGTYPEARENRNRIIKKIRPRPNLSFSADFVNFYGDKALYRGDQGALHVTIHNPGPGRAYNVGIVLMPDMSEDGITIGEYTALDMIPADRKYTVKIPIIASKGANMDEVTFSISLTEEYDNTPDTTVQYTIPVKALRSR